MTVDGHNTEMEVYCQKLIGIIGKDTGFILNSGCTVSTECKYENFKTMIDTTRNYYPHKQYTGK